MIRPLAIAISIAVATSVSANPAEHKLSIPGESNVDQVRAKAFGPKMMAKAALDEDLVGDADSFGREKTYLGVEQTTTLFIQSDCSGLDPEFSRCIEPNPAPANTFVDELDLGSIELPAKATN